VLDATDLDLPQTSVLALNGNIHHRLVLIGEDTGGLLQHLTVMTVLVTPLTGQSVNSLDIRKALTCIERPSW
jgi:hypothetical protein